MTAYNVRARSDSRKQRKTSWLGLFFLLSPFISLAGVGASGAFLLHQLKAESAAMEFISKEEAVKDEVVTEPAPDNNKGPTITDENELQPVFPDGFEIPEYQVYGPDYPVVKDSVLGETVTITGGFMEPHGHSWKSSKLAIFSDRPDEIQVLAESDRNLGHDYVVADYKVRNWYPGTVEKVGWEQGYGLRVHVKFDMPFEFQGEEYTLWGAYAHNNSCSVEVGQLLEQGDEICIMGGSSSPDNLNAYPVHVDFRTWIVVDGQQVDVSPNLVEEQLKNR